MANQTVTIQIGNSDDKLSQANWSDYVGAVIGVLADLDVQVHFSGHSLPWVKWQNAAWVIEIEDDDYLYLRLCDRLTSVRKRYGQESIAVTVGQTEFV